MLTKMTEHTSHSLSEKIIHYDSLVEENERLKSELKKERGNVKNILNDLIYEHEGNEDYHIAMRKAIILLKSLTSKPK